MSDSKAKVNDMTVGTPIKAILLFAVPMLIGNVFQQFYNFVDTTVVGKFVGADALAAVGTTGSMNALLICIAMGLSNGAGVIISQCFGAQRYDEMKKAVTAMMYVASVTGLVITAAGIFLAGPAMRLLGVPDSIIHLSVLYMRIVFGFSLTGIFYNAFAAILRSVGDSRTPLYMLIISSVINVVLDLLFVLKFGMGVAGVAYATVIAQGVSAALCAMYIIKHRYQLHLDALPKLPPKYMVVKIFRIGMPSAFQSAMISLGGISVQGLINSFGTDAMAAYTASSKIDSVAIQILISIAASLSVYSGQNMGAGNIKRIRTGLRQTLMVMIPVCTAVAAVMLIFKRQILGIFLDADSAQNAIEIGCMYLSVIGIGYIIAGIMQSYQNLLKGCGDVNVCVAAGLAELGVRVGASYLFVIFWELQGVFIAIPVSWMCGCIIPVVRYLSGKWTKKSVIR
ncbi:MAG TPA: MATE family efflux transporter [Candidatus Ornithomonoglobus merdipullorum]|uniref:MATE family efflux transporter n=1 Tax=Candidatus Ornithomonoglobus merdipullorum TaxID=2840895 RepID=A0A9D1SFV2_9FIRM|nr:MATE family efflux transporter [Candidatus Ornithomonoglobus merdipullorum]